MLNSGDVANIMCGCEEKAPVGDLSVVSAQNPYSYLLGRTVEVGVPILESEAASCRSSYIESLTTLGVYILCDLCHEIPNMP